MSNQTGFRQGRLGIGKNPIFPLDISGSTRIEGDLILGGTIADINGTPIEFGASSATLNVGTNMPIPEMTVSQVPSWEDSVTIEGAGKFVDAASAGDIYYNGGNIGIGTDDPQNILHVTGTDGTCLINIERTSGTAAYAGQLKLGYNQINTTGPLGTESRNLYIQLANDGDVIFNGGGNVGIGTASPSGKLHISGNQHNTYSYGGLLRLHDDSGSASGIWGMINFPDSNTSSTEATGNYYMIGRGAQYSDKCLTIHVPTAGSIDMCSSGSIRMMKIQGNGDIGIGKDVPGYKLHIANESIVNDIQDLLCLETHCNSGGRDGPAILFRERWNNGSYWNLARIAGIEDSGYGGQLAFYTNEGTGSADNTLLERMRIDELGNVGIGIADPATILHLYDTSPILTIETTQGDVNGRYGYIEWKDSGGAYAWVGDGSGSNKAFYIYTYGDPINLETNGGNVGIGTATPYMPFDCVVSKYISDADIDQYWDRGIDDGAFYRAENDSFGSSYNYNTNQGRIGDLDDETSGSRPVNLKPISAHFYDNVYISNGGLLVSSDERIKQNIMEISDDISLKILRDISCCSYYYIDDIGRQKAPTLGFIAQQVNKIFPEAVTLTERIIPNVMKRINNFNWVSDNSNNTHKLISDLQDVSGVLYRFYVSNNVDEREKRVEHIGNSDNTFTFENKWEHIFCYGYEVPDFHALDKQKLYALNFSATQELDKQQKLDKADIAELKTKNTELENKVTTLEFELAAIKQHLGI